MYHLSRLEFPGAVFSKGSSLLVLGIIELFESVSDAVTGNITLSHENSYFSSKWWVNICDLPRVSTELYKIAISYSFLILFFFFCLFRATPTAVYGGSQAGGPIRTIAAGLYHSHSNIRSEFHLQPTPQLMAMQDS